MGEGTGGSLALFLRYVKILLYFAAERRGAPQAGIDGGRGRVMLEERINEDMKTSLKGGAQERLQTLRMMRSAILLEKKKDASIQILPDAQVLQVLTAYAKKLRESAAEFEKLGQAGAAAKIQTELAVVREYLPAPLTPEETKSLVETVVRELGASSPKDLGRVMKEVTARAQGRADGKALSEMARAALDRG